MKKSLASLLSVGILAPTLAFALNYTDATDKYTDAGRFTASESAAISVLTNLGTIAGNPDGSFQTSRGLNRAEFAKIVISLYIQMHTADGAEYKWYEGGEFSAGPNGIPSGQKCFPDVSLNDWFGAFVCEGKFRGFFEGNPDGKFHPERSVNYAEAVTMLVRIFGYDLPHVTGPWYSTYLHAAADHDVDLSEDPNADTAITRGQAVRLSAAFVAEYQGELDLFRDAERGETVRSSSSMRSSSRSSSSMSTSSRGSSSSSNASSVSSGSSSSASSRAANLPDLPVRSHFLVLGERSEPIVGLKIFNELEGVYLRSVKVHLDDDINSIDTMFLVDENGVEIGQIPMDKLYDSSEQTYRATFSGGAYKVAKGKQITLAVEARLKPRGSGGGGSDELVVVDSLQFGLEGEDSGSTYTATSQSVSPGHQTAQGRITGVTNALSATDSFSIGNDELVGAFTFAGTHVESTELRVRSVEFQVSKSADVVVGDWQLGATDTSDRVACTVNSDIVTCSNIPESLGTLTSGPRTLRLFGDVSLAPGATSPFLQVSINQPGSVGTQGAISWSDGSATFTWTELTQPIARSTKFQ